MYPELPEQFDPDRRVRQKVNVFPNVWAKFQCDTQEHLERCFELDLYEALPLNTRSAEDLAKSKTILLSKYEMLTVAFKMFLRQNLGEEIYPEINYTSFMAVFNRINEKVPAEYQVPKEILDTLFYGSVKADSQVGLRGTLTRQEFVRLIIRICSSHCREKRNSEALSDHLEKLLDRWLMSMYKTSPILLR